MVAQIFILFEGLFLLPILFRLALKLRLGVPMLYVVLALTLFHNWIRANPALADGVLFALVGMSALSWVVTGIRKVCGFIGQCREHHIAVELFARRVRQAHSNGEYAISTGAPRY